MSDSDWDISLDELDQDQPLQPETIKPENAFFFLLGILAAIFFLYLFLF
ncbi:MAG: hypothetical protein ABEI06_04240 [Halobacteriaceae archaeon]